MKIMNIKYDSVADGEGVRSVVFTAGCPHFCRGCHNPKSWNINNGNEMSIEEIVEELEFAGHYRDWETKLYRHLSFTNYNKYLF